MTQFAGLRRITFALPALTLFAGCQPAGTADAGDGGAPMMATAMDTIQFGRNLVLHHGCGDCHGGVDNPAAPVWLDGMRDTLLQQFRIPTPMGVFVTRPRNITPDNETGIGRFSERQIFNAIRYGLRPGETPDVEIASTTPGQGNFPAAPKYLAPPMPWLAFRHMSDSEIWAIAAYLKRGVKPSTNRVADSEGPPDFWAGLYAQFAGPATPPAFPTDREQAPPQ
jgi:mono/diheme cytochrome c family protein